MVIIGLGPHCPLLRFVYVICFDSSEAWHKFKLFHSNCQAMSFILIFDMSPDGATPQQLSWGVEWSVVNTVSP